MTLKNTVALVTGAGRGIGKAVALSLGREGASVVLAARTVAELEQVKKEIEGTGGSAMVVRTDLSKDTDIQRLFEDIVARFSRLDILVNNAGLGLFAPVRELSIVDFDTMWNLNMRAVMLCTQHALRVMEPQKSGAIVNVSSLAGKNAFVGGAGYAATKWALIGFSRSLMLEVRAHNIRVITICPGSVDTSFSQSPKEPSRSDTILHSDDVADTIMAALKLPDRAMVSEIDIRPTNPQ
jgi:3-oxoacyl-[acyl-carrier protein] reductase